MLPGDPNPYFDKKLLAAFVELLIEINRIKNDPIYRRPNDRNIFWTIGFTHIFLLLVGVVGVFTSATTTSDGSAIFMGIILDSCRELGWDSATGGWFGHILRGVNLTNALMTDLGYSLSSPLSHGEIIQLCTLGYIPSREIFWVDTLLRYWFLYPLFFRLITFLTLSHGK